MKIMKINILNYFDSNNYNEIIEKVLNKGSNLLNQQNKEVNIILVNDEKIKELNNQYRHKDYATDVLTFPDGYLNNLGDIFISVDKCKEQAIDLGHSFDRELGFLCVHGFLHTLGYDHQNEEQEKEMIEMQNKILKSAKVFR